MNRVEILFNSFYQHYQFEWRCRRTQDIVGAITPLLPASACDMNTNNSSKIGRYILIKGSSSFDMCYAFNELDNDSIGVERGDVTRLSEDVENKNISSCQARYLLPLSTQVFYESE